MQQIKLLFNKRFFQTKSEMATVCSIIDSYKKMCGFLDGELIVGTTNNTNNDNSNSVFWIFPENTDSYPVNFPITDEVRHNHVEQYLRIIFLELIKYHPEYSLVTLFFFKYRLWELDILLQFCSSNLTLMSEVKKRCTLLLNELAILETPKECQKLCDECGVDNCTCSIQHDYYFKYLKLSVEYIRLFSEIHDISMISDLEIRHFADLAVDYFYESKKVVFIKQAALLLGKHSNPKLCEDMYQRYIFRLRAISHTQNDITNALYSLGKIIETYSETNEQYSILKDKAYEYYYEAFRQDKNNYRATYKMIFMPGKNEFTTLDFHKLLNLYSQLKTIELSTDGEIAVHLYEYKVLNHIGMFFTKWHPDNKEAMSYIEKAELKHNTIKNIWKKLGLKEYNLSLAVLDNYLMRRMLYHNKMLISYRSLGPDSTEYKEACIQLKDMQS